MEDLNRSAEATAHINTIKVLQDRLAEANRDLRSWKINFEFEVTEALGVKITATKPFGGGGIIKTLSAQDVQFWASDVPGLCEDLAEEFMHLLLKDVLKNAMTESLARSINNAYKLGSRPAGRFKS